MNRFFRKMTSVGLAIALCISSMVFSSTTEIFAQSDFDENNIVLRFGVLSDIHISGTWAASTSKAKLDKAYKSILSLAGTNDDGTTKLDAVFIDGDITDAMAVSGSISSAENKLNQNYLELAGFRDVTLDNFNAESKTDKVSIIYANGNHDTENGIAFDENAVADETGFYSTKLMHKVISGYSWQSEIPEELSGTYSSVIDYNKALINEYDETSGEYYDFFYGDDLYLGENGLDYGNRLVKVGDYYFITVEAMTYDTVPVYSDETKAWLDETLAEITTENPDKAVFIAAHTRMANTIFASGSTRTDLLSILNKYPQVIIWGGHNHTPLNREKAIWQGGVGTFTAVDAGVVRYTNASYFTYKGGKKPDNVTYEGWSGNEHRNSSQGQYVEVDANGNVRINRIDFHNSDLTNNDIKVIGEPWVISGISADGSHLNQYTFENRAASNSAPVFSADAAITTTLNESGGVDISFPAATDDTRVISYFATVKGPAGETLASAELTSFYYDHADASEMDSLTYTYSFTDLPEDEQLTVSVYGIDDWGATTDTITNTAYISSDGTAPTGKVVNYFVESGGTGDGRSADSPAPTVYAAITAANTDGLVAGDIANIYVMQRTDWNDTTNLPTHNMAVFNTSGGAMPTHTAKMVIRGYDTVTYLAFGNTTGDNHSVSLGGPTEFKNITLVSPRKKYQRIQEMGNSVTYGSGTKYGYLNVSSTTATWNGTVSSAGSLATAAGGRGSSTVTVSNEVTTVFENEYNSSASDTNTRFYLDSEEKSYYVYEKDYNLIFNNSKLQSIVHLGNKKGGSSTFKGNLNINIKSADSVTIYDSTATLDSTATVSISGGYQVIISGGATYKGDISTFSNVTAVKGAWYMTNNTEFDDCISFTDTAGTYDVKDGYMATATSKGGAVYYSENGLLTVPSGSYTVELSVLPVTKDYYVESGGTGDGRSVNSPAPTVYAAISAVNADGLVAGDTANIYIIQRSDWNDTANAPTHNMAVFNTSGGTLPTHTAKIVIQGLDAQDITYLAFGNTTGANHSVSLGGPTEFKNITLVSPRQKYQRLQTMGNSVTFGSGTKYGYLKVSSTTATWDGTVSSAAALATTAGGRNSSTVTVSDEVTVTYENVYGSSTSDTNTRFYFDSEEKSYYIYEKDYNLIFNNSKLEPIVHLGNKSSGSSTFNGNLNINIKSAKNVRIYDSTTLSTPSTATVDIKGGYQVLINGGAKYTGDISAFSNVTVSKGCWYVTNGTDNSDLLEFTSASGVFKVTTGETVFAQNQTSGNKVISQNGILDLSSEDGEWNVKNINLDLDSDGDTDTDDIVVLKLHLLNNGEFVSGYDINGDGIVNICDLVSLAGCLM